MIGKQFKNQSFRSTLDYVLGKEKATMLDSNMGGTTPRQLASEFGAARRLKPNLQRACAHVILSIPHRDASHEKGEYHEHLEDEQYVEIAQHWLKEMKFLGEGLNKSQYVIARHHDTDHEHIHIIASRIRMDSTVVSDSWDYRRSEVVVRQLEKEYGLSATPCSSEKVATKVKEEYGIETTVSDRRAQTRKQKHHSSGEPPITQLLADIIDEATLDKPTVTELIARLQQQGVVVHPQFSTRGGSDKKFAHKGLQGGRGAEEQGRKKLTPIDSSSPLPPCPPAPLLPQRRDVLTEQYWGLFKDAMRCNGLSRIAFEMNGVKVAGNKLGAAYSFPGLQKKRGVSYDPERDLPALRSCAAGELVELPPLASKQLVEVTLPAKPEVTIDPLSIFEKLKLSINAVAADYPSMPELIAKLYSTGVKVKVEFSTQGLATGISYEIDGISTNGSNLGEQYSFGGLQKYLGIDYNPEWDNRLIETIVDYGLEGRSIDDSYIDRLWRFRQTKLLEQQRMKQVFQVLGIEVEEELPVAMRCNGLSRIALDSDKPNEKAVKSADSWLSVKAPPNNDVAITISTTITDENGIQAVGDTIPVKSDISNDSDDSVTGDGTSEKDAANENDFDPFANKAIAPLASISQEYTDKIGATIRLLWQRQGQPNQINGQHYDLELALETLQVMRKTGEQIASISLLSPETASFQGFTQEDWERFDKLQEILRVEHLQPRQQHHQDYGTELD